MSGAEVIGFLLGAIPLVISAVEHYRDCLDPFFDYAHYKSTLKALRTRLRIQFNLYEGTLKRLLLSELSLTEAESLFPGADVPLEKALWGKKEIEVKLQKKLGKEYETFMDVVWGMDGLMKKLMDKLDIDMEGKPKWTATSTTGAEHKQSHRSARLGWEWRKIRRSFGRKEREALMQDFERYNNNIAAFVQNNEILAPSTESSTKSFLTYFDRVRNHTLGLYEALEQSWKCGAPHRANLRLDGTKPATISSQKEQGFQVFFSLCLDDCAKNQGGGVKELWKETIISIDSTEDNQAALPATSTAQSGTPLKVEKQQPTESLKRKMLRFLDPKEKSAPAVVEIPVVINEPIAMANTPTTNSRPTITCICQAVRSAPRQTTCLGVLSRPIKAGSPCLTITTMAPSAPAIHLSLDNIIVPKEQRASQRSKLGILSRQQRLGLAVTLASTVLQFYNSPWLDEEWGTRDICFFSDGIDEDNRPVISMPYISRMFSVDSASGSRDESTNASTNPFLSGLIVNKMLFALGIVLIELCLNKPFEDLRKDVKPSLGGQATIADDYEVATRSIDTVYDKGGPEYGYVVQRCLRCEFGVQDRKKRLDFDTFRSLVYSGVVAPLEEDYKKYSLYRGIAI
ncbi:hypothetical protein DL98DRAFT_506266 [Cadophora sp. DSE1049]|nr:hypothetical protein DL98DRAFT_506266 [Cadophora sp. DSE1049]